MKFVTKDVEIELSGLEAYCLGKVYSKLEDARTDWVEGSEFTKEDFEVFCEDLACLARMHMKMTLPQAVKSYFRG